MVNEERVEEKRDGCRKSNQKKWRHWGDIKGQRRKRMEDGGREGGR